MKPQQYEFRPAELVAIPPAHLHTLGARTLGLAIRLGSPNQFTLTGQAEEVASYLSDKSDMLSAADLPTFTACISSAGYEADTRMVGEDSRGRLVVVEASYTVKVSEGPLSRADILRPPTTPKTLRGLRWPKAEQSLSLSPHASSIVVALYQSLKKLRDLPKGARWEILD